MKGCLAARCSRVLPENFFVTVGASLSPAAAATWARSAPATMILSAPVSATTYSTSGLSAMARFAGSVQGVVVQMTMLSGLSEGSPKRAASEAGTENRTQIEGEEWSLYSISASARAVSNGIDQ